MKQSLTKQGLAASYTFDRPAPAPELRVLSTFAGINYVFNDPTRFPTVYDMKGSVLFTAIEIAYSIFYV